MKNQPSNRATLKSDGDEWELRLYGAVGDEWDGFTDDSIADLLDGVEAGKGVVRINSPGGYIYQGMAIYSRLAEIKPRLVKIDGLAASMGSVIACAGQRTEIAKGALVMIHNPWNIAMGDSTELRKNADVLDKMKESILNIYQDKTGHDRETLSAMMDEETWLTAEEAVEWGFADAIVETEAAEPQDLAVLASSKHMPAHLRAKLPESGKSPVSASRRDHRAAEPVNSNREELPVMETKTATPSAAPETADTAEAINQAQQAAVAAERKRVADIRAAAKSFDKIDPGFAEKLIDDGLDVEAAKAQMQRLADYLADNEPKADISNRHRIELTRDERDSVRAGAAKAILHRWNPSAHKIEGDDPARQFAGLSLPEMAREMAEARGIKTRGMTRHQIAKAALHTTSDFPSILENVIGKALRSRYELAPRTFTALANQSTLPDYKEVSRAQLGEGPKLQKVLEGGEYTYGTVGEAAEKYRLFKYGKILAITSETIINDDLDAFTRVPAMMGAAAGQLESDLFWAHFTGNPNMHDGTALFHADHGNLGSAAAISIAAIGDGREAMRKQKGLDANHFINVQPSYLVVPAALETTAEQFVSSNFMANTSGNINPFAGRLQVVSEPRLDANSATAWYLFADPAMADTIEYAYLEGEQGPQIETDEGFDVDGIKVKVRHNFGVKALDWRGLFKNPGA